MHITECDTYKGRNEDSDPHGCILDTGCPKTVTGRRWMNTYAEFRGKNVKIRTGKEKESFRFGPSDI